MLGNANARLNAWRQRRFSDFLTHLGKRTLREGIPTDKHLFPHQSHEKIKSEHDHKASTSKLVCKPKEGREPWANSQSFRDSATYRLDLKDAYYAVPIHPESRKYLRFYHEGRTYEFCCLPFGLSLAPRVFTRILRPIIVRLRSEGIRTVIYLDDLLLIHHQKDRLTKIFNYVRRLLSGLGFIVKLEKCSPEPTHRLVFLGAVLDTTCM